MTLSPSMARVQFRAGDLLPALAARSAEQTDGAVSEIARRDLRRYYDLLRRALPAFSIGEASLLMDALNGFITEPYSVHLLWAEVSESLADGLAEKWNVDGSALVARLRSLKPFEAAAVADAIERAWRSGSPSDEALQQVGLVR